MCLRRACGRGLLWLLLAALPGCWPMAPPGTEPPARPALLLLDLGLSAPRLHDDTLRLFSTAGYDAAARPRYPALTRQDVRMYDAIMLLAGSTPTLPGAMLTTRALAPLADFVKAGGVLFLGAPVNPRDDGAGENERTLFNALLRRLDIPIVIQKGWVHEADDVYQNTLYDAPWLYPDRRHPLTDGLPERLSLPRAATLDAGEDAAVLVTTSPTAGSRPVVAMGRRGKGLVVVASRQFFNPTGAYQVETPLFDDPALRTARYQLLERIAGYGIEWIYRRAAWTANGDGALKERVPRDEPAFWRSTPPAPRPPAGASLYTGGPDAPPAGGRAQWLGTLGGRYRWIVDEGIRAGWVYVDRDAPFQRAVRDSHEKARLNLIWGSTDAELMAGVGNDDAQHRLQTQWTRMDQLLRPTGIKWFMGSHYPGAHAKLAGYPPAVGAQGQTIGGMSPLDRAFWEREMFPVLDAEARFSLTHSSVAGLLVDLEMYQLYYWYFTNGFDFGDGAFELYLRELERRGGGPTAEARALAAADRFNWLMENGRLDEYYAVLEQEAERIGRALRERIHAVNPGLIIGFYAAAVPTGWFYDGLLRGAGTREQPVVLFTFQHAPDRELEAGHERGIHLLHAGAVLLGQVTQDGMKRALQARLAREQGYWLNNTATLAVEQPEEHRRSRIESPREGSSADYIKAIAEANRTFKK